MREKAREQERDETLLFIALYSFRVASDAGRICHGGRHYYGKRTYDASFIISKFIVLPWPINSSSLEIGTARECARARAQSRIHERRARGTSRSPESLDAYCSLRDNHPLSTMCRKL